MNRKQRIKNDWNRSMPNISHLFEYCQCLSEKRDSLWESWSLVFVLMKKKKLNNKNHSLFFSSFVVVLDLVWALINDCAEKWVNIDQLRNRRKIVNRWESFFTLSILCWWIAIWNSFFSNFQYSFPMQRILNNHRRKKSKNGEEKMKNEKRKRIFPSPWH